MAEFFIDGGGQRVEIPATVVAATYDRSLVTEFVAAAPGERPAIIGRAQALVTAAQDEAARQIAAADEKRNPVAFAASRGVALPISTPDEE